MPALAWGYFQVKYGHLACEPVRNKGLGTRYNEDICNYALYILRRSRANCTCQTIEMFLQRARATFVNQNATLILQ